MSRGPGALQRALWTMIRQHGKPMTFNDMRADIRKQCDKDGTRYSSLEWSLLYSSLERSLRRALQRMVGDDVVDRLLVTVVGPIRIGTSSIR